MTDKATAGRSAESGAPKHRAAPLTSRLAARPDAGESLFAQRAVQAKLSLSAPGDALETEADRVANAVVASRPVPAISSLAGGVAAPAQPKSLPEDEPRSVQRKAPPREEESVQRKVADDEEAAQRKIADEDESVQRKAADEDEPLQRAVGTEDDEVVQRAARAATPAPSDIAGDAIARRGSGNPLSSGTRSTLESRMGVDLSHVRVHEDEHARASARDLNARAFTHGSDIFLGRGESQSDLGLMAHEATHVVQQSGGVQRIASPVVQRAPDPPATGTASGAAPVAAGATPEVDPNTLPLETGRLNPATETITFAQIPIPGFKAADHRGAAYSSHALKRKKNYDRGNPDQRNVWKNDIPKDQIRTTLEDKIKREYHQETVDPAATYFFQIPAGGGAQPFVFGTLDVLSRELTTPMWDRQAGAPNINFYDVDHIVELQLSGWNDETWPNQLANMELLDSEVNQESGRVIRDNIIAKANDFLRVTGNRFGTSAADIKERYHLAFQAAVGGGGGASSVNQNQFWTRDDIAQARHLGAIRARGPEVLGGAGRVIVFSTATGGLGKSFATRGRLDANSKTWLKPFEIKERTFNTENAEGPLGTFTINIPDDHPDWFPLEGGDETVEIERVPGATYAGFVRKQSLLSSFARVRKKGASPIRIDTFELMPDTGILLEGAVLPELPILRGGLGFRVSNGHLRLYKEFSTSELEVPRPFSISGASLVIFADTESGFGGTGQVDFGIENVGQGFVSVEASTGGPLGVRGGFDFDSSLFEPAHLELAYVDGQFSGHGQLGIPEGKIPGVRSATIDIAVEGDSLSGTGTVVPAIDAIQSGTVTFSYSPEAGITLGGTLTLSDTIPNVNAGSVAVELKKPPGAQAYSLSAHGELSTSMAGFDTTLTADYRDGVFTVEGRGDYQRGLMSGSVAIGATNRAVDEAGNLGDEPTDRVTAFGGGSVTIALTPWLQATGGIRLLPNGEIELSGELALPSAVEVIPEKSFTRNLFSINLDIPIVGVAVAGQRVGIFATIGGGLDLDAGVGPGELRDLRLGITYNPDHEDQTHITGGARFVLPAHAGLRLFVRGSAGAGIPIVSASVGLEIGGALGLEGALEASVDVDWTPATGLVLDALAQVYAQPKFRFDVTAFVLVEASLLLATIELYSRRWELASFEFGSDLRFGIRLPIHYQEGRPFDVDWSDVEFEIPEIEPMELLEGLVDRITGD